MTKQYQVALHALFGVGFAYFLFKDNASSMITFVFAWIAMGIFYQTAYILKEVKNNKPTK